MNLTNACLYMYIVYIQGQLGLAQVLSQWTASCPASLGTLAEIEAINKTKASYQLNILSLGNFLYQVVKSCTLSVQCPTECFGIWHN